MNLKEAKQIAKIFNSCGDLKKHNKTHKRSASEATNQVKRNLLGIQDVANENCVNLGSKYI